MVTVTTGLMCLTNALSFFLVNWHRPNAGGVFFIYFFLIAVGYVVLYFYWRGRNWARWFVLATSVLCLWNLWGLRRTTPAMLDSPVGAPMIVVEAVIAIYLLYYLNTNSARAWFAKRRG